MSKQQRTMIACVTTLLGASVAACGGFTTVDGGPDGAVPVDLSMDTSMTIPDAPVADDAADAGGPTDASDGGFDAASPDDLDGDGVLSAHDCNDMDPTVGTSGTRACTNECGSGMQTCTDGTWGTCDAPTDCRCTTPGMTRSVACGNCGLGSETCGSDHVWGPVGTCFGEGECADGAVEHDTAMCADRSRICDSTCHWLPYEVVTPPGECDPSMTPTTMTADCFLGEGRTTSCSTDCHLVTSDCAPTCSTPAATSLTGITAKCVSAGDFVLGSDTVGSGTLGPETLVTLHEFWIAEYPVTKAQYQMCIDAGACTAPWSASVWSSFADDEAAVMTETESDAAAFCAWDGGRLPTEYEWAKAARGPAPDRRTDPWGSTAVTCAEGPLPFLACLPASAYLRDADGAGPDYIYPRLSPTSFPANVSPYGVRQMGSALEFSSTFWADSYAGLPTTDPTGPATGTDTVMRGYLFCNDCSTNDTALLRIMSSVVFNGIHTAEPFHFGRIIRCAY